jgi:hypothetical protein
MDKKEFLLRYEDAKPSSINQILRERMRNL